jgi:hypothetical protein
MCTGWLSGPFLVTVLLYKLSVQYISEVYVDVGASWQVPGDNYMHKHSSAYSIHHNINVCKPCYQKGPCIRTSSKDAFGQSGIFTAFVAIKQTNNSGTLMRSVYASSSAKN